MSRVIFGVDPDSKAHGVAIYVNGELTVLKSMSLMEFAFELRGYNIPLGSVEVHIEDVCANNAVFMKPGRMDKKREGEAKARGRTLGMCQQSQAELERVCEWYKAKVVKHKISKIWKDDKAQFEKVTGWAGRSNKDTRSAAWFGYLGCN